jgi:hypothetical protein
MFRSRADVKDIGMTPAQFITWLALAGAAPSLALLFFLRNDHSETKTRHRRFRVVSGFRKQVVHFAEQVNTGRVIRGDPDKAIEVATWWFWLVLACLLVLPGWKCLSARGFGGYYVIHWLTTYALIPLLLVSGVTVLVRFAFIHSSAAAVLVRCVLMGALILSYVAIAIACVASIGLALLTRD